MSDHESDWDGDGDSAVATETRKKVKKPELYHVVLHNDDYTTMEFVVAVLMTVFRHSAAKAQQVMLQVHHNGSGIAGTYAFEVAEMKANKVVSMAKKSDYPLRATVEPAS